MKFLLDTHTSLWMSLDAPQLSAKARESIRDMGNELFLSPATYWEIAIKASIGKLKFTESLDVFVEREVTNNSLTLLPITANHAEAVHNHPFPAKPAHKDPFDRLLIAQALCENITILTCDEAFDAYEVDCVW
jgi:PIN domain nuclease of toxin-antitoxin system